MSSAPHPKISFTTTVMLAQVLVAAVLLGIVVGVAVMRQRTALETQYEQRALAVAHTVAAEPGLSRAVAERNVSAVDALVGGSGPATGALFVVVTDSRGVRLYHPNASLVGQEVSTSPDEALSGRDYVGMQTGTLGLSARGKAPVRNSEGAVVGEVSVGFDAGEIRAASTRLVGWMLGAATLVLILGTGASAMIARYMKSRTLGLEPHQLAEMVRDSEAVLHAIREMVLTFDADGRLTSSNESARAVLFEGRQPDDAHVPRGVREFLSSPRESEVQVIGTRLVMLTQRRVTRAGRDLGTVLTGLDRTDVESLGSELATTRTLATSLRAQRHEYANRTHLLRAFLESGDADGALDYLGEVAASDAHFTSKESIADVTLGYFLSAKATLAAEKGVRLELSDTTVLRHRVADHSRLVTVLGNLLDNAIRACSEAGGGTVGVDLVEDGTGLGLVVEDDGPGIPDALRDQVFDEGFSTRSARPGESGFGLSLARQRATENGGTLRFAGPARPGDPGRPGAVFVGLLREVIEVNA